MGTLAGHRFVPRAEWGARAPTSPFVPFRLPAHRLYIHHTASEQHGAQGVRDIQRFHQDTRGWKDIAYTYLVDDDGTIYEGRGHQYIGGHTTGENSTSHAICLMGNFETRPPTAAALRALADLARHGVQARWWAPVFPGHRDSAGASTACPGRHLYAELPAVRAEIANPPPPPEDNPLAAFTEADLLRIAREAVRLELVTGGGDTRQEVFNLSRDASFQGGILAWAQDAVQGDPVYWITPAGKWAFRQGDPLHLWLKAELVNRGQSPNARRIPVAVLEQVPTILVTEPVPE